MKLQSRLIIMLSIVFASLVLPDQVVKAGEIVGYTISPYPEKWVKSGTIVSIEIQFTYAPIEAELHRERK